ncbi:Sua5/YciO/YrdC/YwlC family protein [Hydrotalea sp.]|uniref:Sua5/YciO/YrdC/YwlC family protein n=1 Tax=Hydrotalea sp. TaxID=2881279 RepID=UPI003D0D1548
MEERYETEMSTALAALQQGIYVVLPTEIGWQIACDATNENAVCGLINVLKKHDVCFNYEVLMESKQQVLQYVAAIDLALFDYLDEQHNPITIIFNNVICLADACLNLEDIEGVPIRICNDILCKQLIKRFRKPILACFLQVSQNNDASESFKIPQFIQDEIVYALLNPYPKTQEFKNAKRIAWLVDGTYRVL